MAAFAVHFNNVSVFIYGLLCLHNGGDRFKSHPEIKVKVAALVYSLFDENTLKHFDEVFQIYDSRPKILRKINLLLKERIREESLPDMSLTVREIDVLKLLVRGHSNKEISTALFISTHTVISHRKNITHKLNIKSVAGLTVYAMLNGIISIEELD